MARLNGKVAMITGATGGIGAATAKVFLREGAKVMLVGRSNEKLGNTQQQLANDGATATFVTTADDEAGVEQSVAATIDAFGGIDILFANAGTEGTVTSLHEFTRENFDDILQTNVVGVWLPIKHCITPMTECGGGSIIATSSIAGSCGFPGLGAYVASKHAVNGLVKTAALELADAGIRVNGIAPGLIENRMSASILNQIAPNNPETVLDGIMSNVALKRMGRSEEIAELALFLAGDESSYCTGSIHTMDGGFLAA